MSVWVLTYPVERERKGESRERERKETRNAGNSTSKAAKEVRARFLVFRPADICPGHLFVGCPGELQLLVEKWIRVTFDRRSLKRRLSCFWGRGGV